VLGPLSVETRKAISVPTATSAAMATPHLAVRRRRSGDFAEALSSFDDELEPAGAVTGRSGADSPGDVSAAM
jgi:hypothetical protein